MKSVEMRHTSCMEVSEYFQALKQPLCAKVTFGCMKAHMIWPDESKKGIEFGRAYFLAGTSHVSFTSI